MKRAFVTVGLSVCLLAVLLMAQDRGATAALSRDDATAQRATEQLGDQTSGQREVCTAETARVDIGPVAKKCSFNSDCKYGKCRSGKCGACSFNSECNGWGKCGSGQCGKCSFNSECKGFGECRKGKCTKSPY